MIILVLTRSVNRWVEGHAYACFKGAGMSEICCLAPSNHGAKKMSVAVLDQDERAILVALRRNKYSFQAVAKELDLDDAENAIHIFARTKSKLLGEPNRTPPLGWSTCEQIASELMVPVVSCSYICKKYLPLAITARNPSNLNTSTYYPPIVKKLVSEHYAGEDWFCVWDIVKILGVGQHWVEKHTMQHSSLARDLITKAGRYRPHYPYSVLVQLAIERFRYQEQGDMVTLGQISSQTGARESRARKILTGLDIKPEDRRSPSGKIARCYPHGCIDLVKVSITEYPDQGTWLSIAEIARQLGISHKYARNLLEKLGIDKEKRRSKSTHKFQYFYPPESVQKLQIELDSVARSDGWVNCYQIEQITGRSYLWVQKRLKSRNFECEMRVGKNNRAQLHFPPSVAYELKAEARQQ